MNGAVDTTRRRLLSAALLAAATETFGLPVMAALPKPVMSEATGPSRRIDAGVLSVGYLDYGPIDGPPVILLHGWPYDVHSFGDVAAILTRQDYRVIVPYLRGFGPTLFLSDKTERNGQQAVFATDLIALMDALAIERAVIGGFDWGARTANIIAAIWPERCKALVSVSGYLIGSQDAGRKPLTAEAERSWWYQYYFATARGQLGYAKDRRDFAKLIWRTASPRWAFTDDVFERTVASLNNPDHVDVVIHNYRWRLGLASGERQFDNLEARLAVLPVIALPTITLEGMANGAPHPEPCAYPGKFVGPYAHRLIKGGIGHNLPQEAPNDFAEAIIDVGRL